MQVLIKGLCKQMPSTDTYYSHGKPKVYSFEIQCSKEIQPYYILNPAFDTQFLSSCTFKVTVSLKNLEIMSPSLGLKHTLDKQDWAQSKQYVHHL